MDINELIYADELHYEQLFKARLCELDFPPDTLRILKGQDITTLGELCRNSRKELLRIRFLGEDRVAEIERLLRSMDLALRH